MATNTIKRKLNHIVIRHFIFEVIRRWRQIMNLGLFIMMKLSVVFIFCGVIGSRFFIAEIVSHSNGIRGLKNLKSQVADYMDYGSCLTREIIFYASQYMVNEVIAVACLDDFTLHTFLWQCYNIVYARQSSW